MASDPSKVLTPGTSYTAQISARQADGSYRVTVDDPKVSVSGVMLAMPVLGGHLGLQVNCRLPQLTKVKMVYGAPSFIYAVLPGSSADEANALNRSMVWGAVMDNEVGVTAGASTDQAEDLLEGEVEFTNLYGVSLQFLTTLMRMTAGDRAAVECHLINDMVRIVSAQWRHISGLGEDLIFDHGRPTLERGWSSYRHEVLGALAEKEPYAEMNGDEVDREVLEQKRITAIGRHRFREFVGFAGDFIHSFVSDPPAAMTSLAEEAMGAAGKSWIHRNSDGSIIMQSVADIRFERVCRIPVPVRYAHHEDPSVTRAREYDNLEAAYLKLPQSISPVDPKDVYQLAYHVRSYGRWLGRYHSFARMLQLPGEYKLTSEADSPTPDWNNGEADRKAQNGGIAYYDAYACMAIHRDGSIVLHDGYGSSIVTSNGNVQISAARHMDLEAAGDIRMLAGGSILMKARRNIELSAAMGGLILHSYAWFKVLCEKGSVWLRSNAVTDKAVAAPEPKVAGAPIPEVAGWEAGVSDGFGVLVEAAAGAAAYRSERGVTIAVDGSTTDEEATSHNVSIITNADLTIRGNRRVLLQSSRDILLSAQQFVIASQALLSSAAKMLFGPVAGAPVLTLRDGKLWCKELEALKLRANDIEGKEQGTIAMDPDPSPGQTVKQHHNHIGKLQTPVVTPAGADTPEREQLALAAGGIAQGPPLPWGNAQAGPEWAFPAKDEYIWDPREKVASAIPETITQQHLRLDAVTEAEDRWGGPGYMDWDIRGVISGPRTNARCGFGNFELQYQADDAGEALRLPSEVTPGDPPPEDSWIPLKTSWLPRAKFTIKSLKRPTP